MSYKTPEASRRSVRVPRTASSRPMMGVHSRSHTKSSIYYRHAPKAVSQEMSWIFIPLYKDGSAGTGESCAFYLPRQNLFSLFIPAEKNGGQAGSCDGVADSRQIPIVFANFVLSKSTSISTKVPRRISLLCIPKFYIQ